MANLDNVYTIDGYSEALLEDDITDYHFSILHKGDNVQTVESNIIFDYIDELKSVATKIEFSNMNYFRYNYRPDLLSYDLYGTIDYEFIILALNDLSSPDDFTGKTYYILDPDSINDVLGSIFNAEEEYISLNRDMEGI